jgi:hypothetical protein
MILLYDCNLKKSNKDNHNKVSLKPLSLAFSATLKGGIFLNTLSLTISNVSEFG